MTEKELIERDRSDIAAIFSTREGRRFLSRLIYGCGVYTPFLSSENSERTHDTALHEGARNVGLNVLGWLQDVDENAVTKLFEATKERTIDEWEKTE